MKTHRKNLATALKTHRWLINVKVAKLFTDPQKTSYKLVYFTKKGNCKIKYFKTEKEALEYKNIKWQY